MWGVECAGKAEGARFSRTLRLCRGGLEGVLVRRRHVEEGVAVAHHLLDPSRDNVRRVCSLRMTVCRQPVRSPFERPDDTVFADGCEPVFPGVEDTREHTER